MWYPYPLRVDYIGHTARFFLHDRVEFLPPVRYRREKPCIDLILGIRIPIRVFPPLSRRFRVGGYPLRLYMREEEFLKKIRVEEFLGEDPPLLAELCFLRPVHFVVP